MNLSTFYIRAVLYIICLILSFYGLSALNYEKAIKANHVWQAQLLYGLLVIALAYLVAQFLFGFLFRI